MGYEYHRQSYGTRLLSPWRKNPGYREEEGKQETRKARGKEAAGMSGGVARVSTVDHRGKLASAESRPQSAAAPPAAAAVGVASTLSRPSAAAARITRREPSHPRVPV